MDALLEESLEGRLELQHWLVRRPPLPTRPGALARAGRRRASGAGWAPPEGASRESVADALFELLRCEAEPLLAAADEAAAGTLALAHPPGSPAPRPPPAPSPPPPTSRRRRAAAFLSVANKATS